MARPDREPPGGMALAAAVRVTALLYPRRAAIVAGPVTVTYVELLAAVQEAAKGLARAGVAPGDVVCLHARRVAALPVALLAAWTAGAGVALLDASLPPACLEQGEALAQAGWRLRLDAPWSSPAPPAVTATGRPPGRTDASHILLTSGTRGNPAAVAVPAAALAAMLSWYARTFEPGGADRVSLLAGPGHDPVLRDVLVPLSAGATLVVHPPADFASPRALARSIAAAGTTIAHATPGLLELILAGQASGRASLASLRLVVSGGAPLTVSLARRLRAALGPRPVIVNAYGATETPQVASCSIIEAGGLPPAGLPGDATVDVGSGVAGAELRIDPENGEIIVCSPHLALGYLAGTGRPGRFAADPGGRPGYRAYRTGDRGEYVAAGHRVSSQAAGVRVLGRLDRQISYNGHRISPEEIEAATASHPGVLGAHASLRTGPAGDYLELAVAAAGPGGAEPLGATSVRSFLAQLLPAYAVPARIRIIEGTALNHNHKLIPTGPE